MPKIAILNVVGKFSYGGIETVLLNYANVIDRSAFIYDFIVMDNSNSEAIQKLKNVGSSIFVVSSRRTNILKHIFQTYKILKRNKTKYDILHCHANQNSFITLFIGYLLKYKIRIAHSHTSYINNKLSFYIRVCRFLTSHFATHGAGCSKAALEFLFQKMKIPQAIIKNPIVYSDFKFNKEKREQYRTELDIGTNKAFVLIGRLGPEKNHLFLCSIMQNLNNSILFFIGDGSEREKITDFINENNLSSKIKLLGVRNNINEIINAFDCLLLPSIHEGFSLVLIEAQVNGLPCLVSDRVPKDAIISNRIKYLTLDESQWLEKMAEVPIRDDFSSSCVNIAYDLNNAVKDLEKYYESLVVKV